MPADFHESYRPETVAPPSERATGLVFAAVAVVVALIWRQSPVVPVVAGTLAVAFAALALLAPALLGPLNRIWFRFGMLLHRIVNPVVMFVLFAVTIVPFGLAMQLKRDPLRRRRQPGATTYWLSRDGNAGPAPSMRNQF